jgi:Ca2+-binding RTX toxin-like protein
MSVNVIRNDQVQNGDGTRGDDHIIHHRDLDISNVPASVGLHGGDGNDTLEGSTPYAGQIHMFGGNGDDTFILDMTNFSGTQGHHAFGGEGSERYEFVNVGKAEFPITGRLDEFNYTEDRIFVEGVEIDLMELPRTVALPDGGEVLVRVLQHEQESIRGEDLGSQQFLAIGDNIFYALEGARDGVNFANNPVNAEERHFFGEDAVAEMREAPSVDYVDPQNQVNAHFFEHRVDLNLVSGRGGLNVRGSNDDDYLFGIKSTTDGVRSGAQTMHGRDGDDIINANTGNDTVFGGDGNDLIAGGIDFDELHGDAGDDMLWGGDGNDTLYGGEGNDFLDGGRNDDVLFGGPGNNTLVGGQGNDTLTGGGENRTEEDIYRYHFADGDGHDVITDFDPALDLITFQDNVDPSTIRIWEDENGHTMIGYGQDGSVQLLDISLVEFQEYAEERADDDDDIITISPDPEDELLEQLRDDIVYYEGEEPPSLFIPGIEYGPRAFFSDEPGGYRYTTAAEEADRRQELEAFRRQDDEDDPIIPMRRPRPEEEEEDEDLEDEDEQPSILDSTCFVATAAFDDPRHPDVVRLRKFRDEWLVHRAWGKAFVAFYWKVGPVLARHVRGRPLLAVPSRRIISGIVSIIRKVQG